MLNSVAKHLAQIPDVRERLGLTNLFNALANQLSSQCVRTAGLVITATSGKYVPKIGAADAYFVANGVLVKIAAGTDMPSLGATNTITATKFNVYCFFVDSAGAVTSAMGTEGAAIANIVFPPFPLQKALVGFIIVTYASTFTPDSIALDTATTVYVSPTGPFEPSVKLS